MTVPVTIMYEISNESGQVGRVRVLWNGIFAHALGDSQDAIDIYTRETGIHTPARVASLGPCAILRCPGLGFKKEINFNEEEEEEED